MSISAQEVIKQRKRDDWNDSLEAFMDDPQSATNHLALGMSTEQRKQARGISKSQFHTWI